MTGTAEEVAVVAAEDDDVDCDYDGDDVHEGEVAGMKKLDSVEEQKEGLGSVAAVEAGKKMNDYDGGDGDDDDGENVEVVAVVEEVVPQ